jgi:GTPase SAR1 family protein
MSIESSTVGGRTKVKIVLLGDQSVGKSAIIEKFVNDKFTEIGCVI